MGRFYRGLMWDCHWALGQGGDRDLLARVMWLAGFCELGQSHSNTLVASGIYAHAGLF